MFISEENATRPTIRNNTKKRVYPREHYNAVRKGKHHRAKKAYNSMKDAIEYIDARGLKEKGYQCYLCSYCGKYHIGHSNEYH